MDEKTMADEIPTIWHELVLKSKNIDASLVVVKKKFTQVGHTWMRMKIPILLNIDVIK